MEARINRGSKRYRSKKGVGGLSSMTITLKVFLDWKGRSLRCEYSETWGNVAPKKPLSFILRISPVFYIYDSWVCNIFGMSFECSAGFKLTTWLKCCRDFRFKRTQKFVISCCCSVWTELRMYKVLKRTCCAILLLIRYFVSFSLLSLSWSSLSPYSHEKGDVWKEWTR